MNSQVEFIVEKMDGIRARSLWHLLKSTLLRDIYRQCSSRLALGFLLTTLFYFPIALLRPDLLLISGPLIFGYPHVMASYRYIEKNSVWFFLGLTLLCILGHQLLTQLPFGVWQIVVASMALVLIKIVKKEFDLKIILPSLLFSLVLIKLVYWEPIIFIGASLILHNWIGFFYWIRSAKNFRRRYVASLSLLLFSLIHFLVLTGTMDNYFPLLRTEEVNSTGWYLASWSQDPNLWYRFLVLYAFGLSVHYFVWLKAIPETLNPMEHPNSFRMTLNYLKQDFGLKALVLMLIVSVAGIGIWLFSLPLGSKIYFECAILHGYLEIFFLFSRFEFSKEK